MKLADINQTAASKIRSEAVALLPIGATEVHSDHLPVGTDIFLAEAVAEKVEERLGYYNCVIMPTIQYGQVWSLRRAPGSVNIPDNVLSPYIVAVVHGAVNMGLKRIAIINSHVGNLSAIKAATRTLYDENQIKTYAFTYPGADEVISKVCTTPLAHKGYFHACEIETSYMLYLCPEKVDMEKATCQYPAFPEDFDYTPTPWTDFMDSALLGDATKATKEKGEAIIKEVIDKICEILQLNK